MLLPLEDSFRFSDLQPQPSGLDQLMEAISSSLEPHLGGEPFNNHFKAGLSISSTRFQVSLEALTSTGEDALRRFTGDQ